jgi:hypothetical protein
MSLYYKLTSATLHEHGDASSALKNWKYRDGKKHNARRNETALPRRSYMRGRTSSVFLERTPYKRDDVKQVDLTIMQMSKHVIHTHHGSEN